MSAMSSGSGHLDEQIKILDSSRDWGVGFHDADALAIFVHIQVVPAREEGESSRQEKESWTGFPYTG